MADFSQYTELTGEWRRELERNPSSGPSFSAAGMTVEVQNMGTGMREKASAAIMEQEGLRSKLIFHTFTIPVRDGSSIEARAYLPSAASKSPDLLPVYIWLHEGAFFTGSLDSEDAICSRIAVGLGNIVVLHINHRHVPQFTYPTHHTDVFDAFDWLLEGDNLANSAKGDPKRIIVAGGSSGANIAAALAVREILQGEEIRIAGLHLVWPWLVSPSQFPSHLMASEEKRSWTQNKDALVLQPKIVESIFGALKIPDPTDTYFNTLNRPDEVLKKFPPTAIAVSGWDPLRDEGLLLGKRLAENGVPTKVHCFQGSPHAFAFRYGYLEIAKRWNKVVLESVEWLASGDTKVSGGFKIINEVTD